MGKYIGEIGLILTAIIWGIGFPASAMALDHYTPYQIIAGRFLIGFLILSLVFYKRLKKINRNVLIKSMALGAILYIAFLLQTVGLQFTTPSKNAFLTVINVVIVPFIGFAFYKKRLDLFELVGAVMAVIGIAVLSLQFSGTVNIGDILTLCCAIGFAFHIFYTAKFVSEEDPVLITIIQMFTAALLGAGVVVAKGETTFAVGSDALIPLLFLGVFSTTLAYLLQTVSQKYITETKAAIILSTEALWGTLFSVILVGELFTIRLAIGALLIIGAIMIAETKVSFRLYKRERKLE